MRTRLGQNSEDGDSQEQETVSLLLPELTNLHESFHVRGEDDSNMTTIPSRRKGNYPSDPQPCLDGKTGLLTGMLSGKQGWKCPVALLVTCCGSKSLKVIRIDSDFRAYPVLNPLVTP